MRRVFAIRSLCFAILASLAPACQSKLKVNTVTGAEVSSGGIATGPSSSTLPEPATDELVQWSPAEKASNWDVILSSDETCLPALETVPGLNKPGYTPAASVADGDYFACVTEKDSEGNSVNTQVIPVKIDRNPPLLTLDASAGLPKGESNQEKITVTIPGDAVIAVKVAVGNEPFDCANPGNYVDAPLNQNMFKVDVTGLKDGSIKLCVIASGTNGKWTPVPEAPSRTWILDRVAPAVTMPEAFAANASYSLSANVEAGAAIQWTSQGPGPANFSAATSSTTMVAAAIDGSYTLSLTATDAAGNQSQANVTMTWDTTGPTFGTLRTPADAPGDADTTFDNDLAFFLAWDRAIDTGVGLRDYTVKMFATNNCSGPATDTPGYLTETLAATAANGAVITFSLDAYDKLGNLSSSGCSTSLGLDLDAPNGLAAPTDHGIYDDQVLTFSWLAGSDNGLAGVNSYFLEIRTTPGNVVVFSDNVGNVLTHQLVGVQGESYLARVKAVDAATNAGLFSPDSDGVTIDAEAPNIPAAPTDAGSYVTGTTVTFNWLDPGDVGPAGIASYDLEVGSTPGANDVYAGNLVGLTYSFTGTNGFIYYARVRAIDKAGNTSAFSDNSNGIMVDTTDPAAATLLVTPADSAAGLDATYDDDTSIFFRWAAATDGESGIDHYDVTVHDDGSCGSVVGNLNGLTVTNATYSGATGTTYSFAVKAFDAAGRSTSSGCSTPITILDQTPIITAVTAPTNPVVSTTGIVTQSLVNVTCDMDGDARIEDAADGDQLVDWTPVTAATPEPLTILGSALAAASGDGTITLRVKCRNLALVESAVDTSRTVDLDTQPPPALSNLVGSTGSVSDGNIDLTITYPGVVADFDRLSVRRIAGAVPPANCAAGTEAMVIHAPFNSGAVIDATGSTIGESFSYRFCIYDIPGNETDSLTQANLRAFDNTIPPALVAFNVNTGASTDGEVDLSWTFPVTTDYDHMDIRELGPGGSAPNALCSDGSVIQTISSPFAQTSYTAQTGSTTGEFWGYRACIYDRSGNLRSTNVVSNVQSLDTFDPLDVISFSALAGSNHGDIDLTVQNPADVSDWDKIEIRSLSGGSAPADCTLGGVLYTDSSGPFGTSGNPWTYVHATGADAGDQFSYRVCIYDTSTNLTSSFTSSASAKDTQVVPSTVTAFSGVTGSSTGDVDLTVTFGVTTDFQTVTVRRLDGATPPDSDCTSDGSVVKTYTTPTFTSGSFVDTGTGGSYYSYRLCIYDGSANLASTQILSNVQAKAPCAGVSVGGFCWYEGTNGGSCTSACAAHGGYNGGTLSYAGSGGVFANCVAVWTALGRGALADWGDNACSSHGAGCIYAAGNKYRCTPATVEGFGQAGTVRACACNN